MRGGASSRDSEDQELRAAQQAVRAESLSKYLRKVRQPGSASTPTSVLKLTRFMIARNSII